MTDWTKIARQGARMVRRSSGIECVREGPPMPGEIVFDDEAGRFVEFAPSCCRPSCDSAPVAVALLDDGLKAFCLTHAKEWERGQATHEHVEQGPDAMTTITLPSITGTLTVDKTDSGVVVSVSIAPGPTERRWTSSCKFASMPDSDVLDNAVRRMFVSAMQKWLMEGGLVHPVLEVRGVEAECKPPMDSSTSSPPSTESINSAAGSAHSSMTSTG